MKRLCNVLSICLLSIPIITGCGGYEPNSEKTQEKTELRDTNYNKEPEQVKEHINLEGTVKEYVKLPGTVFGDRYIPASKRESYEIESEYSFSMNTKLGNKSVKVESQKEKMDSLIGKETKVEIEIEKDKIDNRVYTVSADKIKILD